MSRMLRSLKTKFAQIYLQALTKVQYGQKTPIDDDFTLSFRLFLKSLTFFCCMCDADSANFSLFMTFHKEVGNCLATNFYFFEK